MSDPNLCGRPKSWHCRSAGVLVLNSDRETMVYERIADKHRFADFIRAEYLSHSLTP